MIASLFTKYGQAVARRFGYEVTKAPHRVPPQRRPVGNMRCLLEDVAGRGLPVRSILDVGANQGDWSRVAAAVFPEATFILVEPQLEMRDHLGAFCRDFPQARLVEAGAGPAEGELTLTIWEDFQGSSFLPDENTAVAVGKQRRKIKIVTLDSLYTGSEPPDLAKLDIQGFELEALKGAGTFFGRTELFILEASLFEFTPNGPLFSEVVTFMAQRGYEVYDLPGFARRPFDAALGQADIAFAKRDGFLRASKQW